MTASPSTPLCLYTYSVTGSGEPCWCTPSYHKKQKRQTKEKEGGERERKDQRTKVRNENREKSQGKQTPLALPLYTSENATQFRESIVSEQILYGCTLQR